MKVYFVDVLMEKTQLFLKTKHGTSRAHFNIEGEKLEYIYNSCKFCYERVDIVMTPKVLPYDDVHENIFSEDLSFAGHSYETIEMIINFVLFIINSIDDSGYEIVFLIASDMFHFKEIGYLNDFIGKIIKNFSDLKYGGTFHHDMLYHSALNFIAMHNGMNNLYVNDVTFHAFILNKGILSHHRYENSIAGFAEEMKYGLDIENLTDSQINKIFFRAYHQYDKHHNTDIVVQTKDRELMVKVETIQNRMESGKYRFEQFITKIRDFNRFTCYLEIDYLDIYRYTKDLINKHLSIDEIIKVDNNLYDYIFGYCLLLIKYHRKEGPLLRIKLKRSRYNAPFDGHHIYSLTWNYDKTKLLNEIPSLEVNKYLTKNIKKIIA